MNNLPDDIIINIFSFCDIKNLGNLGKICAHYNYILKTYDEIWKKVADNRWGPEFFIIAKRRSIHISKPLTSYREELIRIITFENYAKYSWNINEYYDYWYCQELYYHKQTKIIPHTLSIYLSKGLFPI